MIVLIITYLILLAVEYQILTEFKFEIIESADVHTVGSIVVK